MICFNSVFASILKFYRMVLLLLYDLKAPNCWHFTLPEIPKDLKPNFQGCTCQGTRYTSLAPRGLGANARSLEVKQKNMCFCWGGCGRFGGVGGGCLPIFFG